jgi:hypothetical protein
VEGVFYFTKRGLAYMTFLYVILSPIHAQSFLKAEATFSSSSVFPSNPFLTCPCSKKSCRHPSAPFGSKETRVVKSNGKEEERRGVELLLFTQLTVMAKGVTVLLPPPLVCITSPIKLGLWKCYLLVIV